MALLKNFNRLDMQGAVGSSCQTCFLKYLCVGWVCVGHSSDVFCRSTKLHCHHCLGNHIGCSWTNHVDPKDLVCTCICQYLDHPIRIHGSTGTPRSQERKLAYLVPSAQLLQLLFGIAYSCYLWPGVDHSRNQKVVDVRLLTSNGLRYKYTFLFRLVCQHCPFDHITDGINMRCSSL